MIVKRLNTDFLFYKIGAYDEADSCRKEEILLEVGRKLGLDQQANLDYDEYLQFVLDFLCEFGKFQGLNVEFQSVSSIALKVCRILETKV